MNIKQQLFRITILFLAAIFTHAVALAEIGRTDISPVSDSEKMLADFLDKAPLKLIDIGGQKLAYRHLEGKGRPLLFIHGTLGDHHSWLKVAAHLASEIPNPIIMYDMRGHSSSKLLSSEQGSIVQDASDAVKLLKALGYDSANLVGHSYGANISAKIANTYPSFVSSLILYEPPAFGLLSEKQVYQPGIQQATALFANSLKLLAEGQLESGIKLFIENIAYGPDSWTQLLDTQHKQAILANYETYIDQTKDTSRLNINFRGLNSYPGSISLLTGNKSLPHFQASIKELAIILEKEKIITIEGAGHGGIFTHPKIIAEKIIGVL